MTRFRFNPLGRSYRGPLTIPKGKKLTLPQDLFRFISKAMKDLREQEVVITIHSVDNADSVWDFVDNLENGPHRK